jgi:hypothetical protein
MKSILPVFNIRAALKYFTALSNISVVKLPFDVLLDQLKNHFKILKTTLMEDVQNST